MEVLNGSAFLPVLVVLELLGMKIYCFLICVEETEITTNLGLPQLVLDLVSTAWIAGMMNNGYNFRFEIPLVVSLAEIPLVL